MFVGRAHGASQVESVDVVCACAACAAQWTLRVRAVGVGYAVAPYFIGSTKAKSQAVNTAHYDAIATAQLAVSFVKCRACGHSLVGRRRHWLVKLIPAFVAFVIAGLLGPFTQPREERMTPVESVVIGLLIALGLSAIVIATRLKERRRAYDAASRIEWFRGEPPDKPRVGVPCAICNKKIKTEAKSERCPECGAATHKRCAREHAFAAHARKDPGAYRSPKA